MESRLPGIAPQARPAHQCLRRRTVKFLRILLAIFFVVLLITAPRLQSTTSRQTVAGQQQAKPLQGRNFVYYTTQAGDTLSTLERKFRVSSQQAILDMNPGLNSEKLTPGQ